MIYEIRTYTLKAGMTAEFEKRWGGSYPTRKKYSDISGFFHTEFGPLNQVVHIWPYESLEERTRIRDEAAKEPNWPPPVRDLILNQQVEILIPFGFAPAWTPGKLGPIYELRQYSYRPDTLDAVKEEWQKALPERMKYSSPCLLGNIEFGPTANSFIHMWAYESLEHRAEVRGKAAASGMWPPKGGPEHYLVQQNKLLLPAAFSPSQ